MAFGGSIVVQKDYGRALQYVIPHGPQVKRL